MTTPDPDRDLLLAVRELVIRAFELPPDEEPDAHGLSSLVAGLHRARAQGSEVVTAREAYDRARAREARLEGQVAHHAHVPVDGVWRVIHEGDHVLSCSPCEGVTCRLLPGVSYLPENFSGEFFDHETNLRALTGQIRLVPPNTEIEDGSVQLSPHGYWTRFDRLFKMAESGAPMPDGLLEECVPFLSPLIQGGEPSLQQRAQMLLHERATRLARKAEAEKPPVFGARPLKLGRRK